MRKTKQFTYSEESQNIFESVSKVEQRNQHLDSYSSQNANQQSNSLQQQIDMPQIFRQKNSNFSIFPKGHRTDFQLRSLIKWKRSSLSKEEPQNIRKKQLQQMKELYSDWKKYIADQQQGSSGLQVQNMIRRMVYYRSQMLFEGNNGFWLNITNSTQDKYRMVLRNCRGEILLYSSQVKKNKKLKQIRDIINNRLTEKSLCFIIDETVKTRTFIKQVENEKIEIIYYYRNNSQSSQQIFQEDKKFIYMSKHLEYLDSQIESALEFFDKIIQRQNQILQQIRGKKTVQKANITFDAMLVNLWKAKAAKSYNFSQDMLESKQNLNEFKKIFYIVQKLMEDKIQQLQKVALMKASELNQDHYPQLMQSCKSCKVCNFDKAKTIVVPEPNEEKQGLTKVSKLPDSSSHKKQIKVLNSTKTKYRCQSCSNIYGIDVSLCPENCFMQFHMNTTKYLRNMKLRQNRKTPFEMNQFQEKYIVQEDEIENKNLFKKQINQIDCTSNLLFNTINQLIEDGSCNLAESCLKTIAYQVTNFLLQLNQLSSDETKKQLK